jgi:hypothetical protein
LIQENGTTRFKLLEFKLIIEGYGIASNKEEDF